jgi:hypothetical protein
MFSGTDGIAAGRIHNQDSLSGSCWDIDIIYADTGSRNGFQFAGISQHFRGDFSGAADNQAVIFADDFRQLVFAYVGFDDGLNAMRRIQ